jgi:hypothetical protein
MVGIHLQSLTKFCWRYHFQAILYIVGQPIVSPAGATVQAQRHKQRRQPTV